jgi:opacity protein-like surface antigen
MRNKIGLVLVGLALVSWPAFAQRGNSEVSVNFTGDFQKQAFGQGITDTASYSGGLLANYRYHFNRWSAIEANYGHTQFTQFYGSGNISQASLNEASLAYQFTFGVAREARFHPFLESGVGALFFSSPSFAGSNVSGLGQNRPAFLYGGGVTYRLKGGLNVQAGYRGLVYTAADFSVPTQLTNATTHIAEPYVGLTFRF